MTGAGTKRAKRDKYSGQLATRNFAQDAPSGNMQQGPSVYDGPSDFQRGRGPGSSGGPPDPAPGRTPSNAPPSAGAPSVRSSSRPGSQTRPVLRDPARDPPQLPRNVDWAGNAYNLYSEMPTQLMPRPNFNTTGKGAPVLINSHPVTKYPTKQVYQYDVQIGNGAEKRALIKAVWASRALQAKLGKFWIFDGNKLAWAQKDLGEKDVSMMVDLDAERGITPREGHTNSHRVKIRRTGRINLQVLESYLAGTYQFDTVVLEAINFLDHLLRETPSKNLINIKRSYFARNPAGRKLFGGGVEAMKGVYQSIRAAQCKKLVLNVDVSNSTFWHQSTMMQLAFQICGHDDMATLHIKMKPLLDVQGRPTRDSPSFVMVKRLAKNEFTVKHHGCTNPDKVWKILRVSDKSAKTYKFDLRDRRTNTVIPNTSVADYYLRRYNVHLQYPDMNVVETTKRGVVYPMELCIMRFGQRYPYKLDDKQTAEMIRFAVTKPKGRKESIQEGLRLLDWATDPFLNEYGLKIDPNMLKTDARVLNPPSVLYGNNQVANPGYSGRWDLRGKVFLKGNPAPLKSWGVCVIGHGTNKQALQAFIEHFIRVYRDHGGTVQNTSPYICSGVQDVAEAVSQTFTGAGNQVQLRPQILMFILPNRSAEVYKRIKKNCECRFGVMSQCVLAANVLKNQAQYHSNVCMKFNAKLGGTTCRIKLPNASSHFKVPTMIIGADVSHGAPGSQAPSMAAMTISMDQSASRYAAAVETNGHRSEIIATRNLEDMLKPQFTHWAQNIGGGRYPQHVYYFRDGVSEGQYQAVLKREVADIKRLLYGANDTNPNYKCKFTVVVAEKRHHIRFFPPVGSASDKNGNPVPGVLVEKDVTHPNEYDFYLCSHAAIQGTARPTHYHVLMDEAEVPVNDFQKMLYEHSYQYMRATTPVSLFPAIYYAHLASNRAAAHENKSQDAIVKEKITPSSDPPATEAAPLLPMLNNWGIKYGMWYI